jgi:hypothetical protein
MPCSYSFKSANGSIKGLNGCCGQRRGEKRTVIEPVPEAVEAMLYKVFGCSKIEPGIDYS